MGQVMSWGNNTKEIIGTNCSLVLRLLAKKKEPVYTSQMTRHPPLHLSLSLSFDLLTGSCCWDSNLHTFANNGWDRLLLMNIKIFKGQKLAEHIGYRQVFPTAYWSGQTPKDSFV